MNGAARTAYDCQGLTRIYGYLFCTDIPPTFQKVAFTRYNKNKNHILICKGIYVFLFPADLQYPVTTALIAERNIY